MHFLRQIVINELGSNYGEYKVKTKQNKETDVFQSKKNTQVILSCSTQAKKEISDKMSTSVQTSNSTLVSMEVNYKKAVCSNNILQVSLFNLDRYLLNSFQKYRKVKAKNCTFCSASRDGHFNCVSVTYHYIIYRYDIKRYDLWLSLHQPRDG